MLFFDEPLSAIDYKLRKTLEKELKDLHRETGKTFVYITHSLEEAMVMSDRIGVMRAGKLVQIGTPEEIYTQPADRFVSEFVGEVNVIAVERAEGEFWRRRRCAGQLPHPAAGDRRGRSIVGLRRGAAGIPALPRRPARAPTTASKARSTMNIRSARASSIRSGSATRCMLAELSRGAGAAGKRQPAGDGRLGCGGRDHSVTG